MGYGLPLTLPQHHRKKAEFFGWVIEVRFDFDVGRSIRHFLLIERKQERKSAAVSLHCSS